MDFSVDGSKSRQRAPSPDRSLTNSLDTRDYVKIRATLLSGHPNHPYFCININHFEIRKKEVMHKTNTNDDERPQITLKRIGIQAIPQIEEVNIFKDETIIQFLNRCTLLLLQQLRCGREWAGASNPFIP
nr:hypothetical protein [Tanacetum cinerariifolium]